MKEIWFLICIAIAVWLGALNVTDPIVLGHPLNLKLALFFFGLISMGLFGQRDEEPRLRLRRRRYGWWW
jgi:hypothetical protein